MQSDTIAVLGMGNMGRALIRALTRDGHRVVAWNRSDRSKQAADLDVVLAKDPASAVAASDVILSCLSGYDATCQILKMDGIARALNGKTLIQFSTGLPEEATAMAHWAVENRVQYLDGKISVVPESVGTKAAVMFYAGDEAVFQQHIGVLQSLAGNPVHLGADAAAACKGDFAFLCYFFLSTIGALYGTAFWQACGFDPQRFLSLVPNFTADILGRLPAFKRALASQDFTSQIQSTLKVDLNGAKLLAMSAQRVGLANEPSNFMVDCFQRAVDVILRKRIPARLCRCSSEDDAGRAHGSRNLWRTLVVNLAMSLS